MVRDNVHGGSKMEEPSYSVPKYPVQSGTDVDKEDQMIIESMPIKSVMTYPKTSALAKSGQTIKVRGHAWAGDLNVTKVEISTDYGQTWENANLKEPLNHLSWQDFNTSVILKESRYNEILVRETHENGKPQPVVVAVWNPRGYLNNATHRVSIKID